MNDDERHLLDEGIMKVVSSLRHRTGMGVYDAMRIVYKELLMRALDKLV